MQVVWALFGWSAAVGYLLATAAVLLTLWQPRRRLPFNPLSVCFVAAGCHGLFIAEGVVTGWLRLNTPEAVAAALSGLLVASALWLWQVRKMEVPAAFLLPLAAVLVTFSSVGKPMYLPAHLRRDMLLVHVSLLMAGYFALMLAFGAAIAHLLTLWSLKRKRPLSFLQKLPPLEATEHLASRWVLVGLPLLTLGMMVGVVWAKWEGRPAWTDPKVFASLLTWAIFAAYLHARWVKRWEAAALHWLIVIGFALLLVTFLTVQHTLAA
ncbi:Cytochrome c biogenesis protein CcsA [bacterium HR17]|uniref:Cytochrome c biogenesis protein CcsA n=1 Tax=Candidatus Fervidibacter japonicus TaxID=2035412 RepID=A0A2H5XAK3_9BACT|nr:Cytochrome c biogenesis protein CcsA [bacterium HR17]